MLFRTLDERILFVLGTTRSRTDAWCCVLSFRERSADRKTFVWPVSGSAVDTTTSLWYSIAESSRCRLANRTTPEAFNPHSASEHMFARQVLASQLNCAKKTMSTRLFYLPLYVLLLALPLCFGSHGREMRRRRFRF